MCLNAGANDLGGTLMNESISRAAGTQHGQEFPPEAMEQLIGSLVRTPAAARHAVSPGGQRTAGGVVQRAGTRTDRADAAAEGDGRGVVSFHKRTGPMMLRLVPNIFYEKLSDGLDLFVACLGFSVLYQDDELAVVSRDGAKAYLVESAEFAAKDRPQIAIETDTIEDIFEEVSMRAPHILHPSVHIRSN